MEARGLCPKKSDGGAGVQPDEKRKRAATLLATWLGSGKCGINQVVHDALKC
jgi:hypothetical protein